MNTRTNKFLVGLVMVLIVANIASIALFWMKDPKPQSMEHPRSPADFLITELQLNTQQQKQFEILRNEHRKAAGVLREKVKNAKEELFDLLKKAGVADSLKHNAVRRISLLTEELDLVTFNHFESVRAICTAPQQNKFDEIIKEVTRMMAPPLPPDRRPPMRNFDEDSTLGKPHD